MSDQRTKETTGGKLGPISEYALRSARSHYVTETPITPASGDRAWEALVTAAKAFAPHLDQWEKVKFETEHGTVFLTIGRQDPYPDSFEEVT